MMKKILLYFSLVLAFVNGISTLCCTAQKMSDSEIIAAIKEQPYRAAGCHSPYFAPSVKYSPAPAGYKAFYISHLGRHGSRFQTNGAKAYDQVIALLDSLHFAKALTPEGDSLRMELTHMKQQHNGMDGILTRKGAAEHTGIASRLAKRSPSVFRQKDRKIVYCTSTQVQRTTQSMAGFVVGLQSECPSGLEFSIGAGIDMVNYSRPEDTPDLGKKDSLVALAQKRMMVANGELDELQARLFLGYKASQDDLYKIFTASSSAGCLDIDVDPLRFFTTEELFAFYKRRDVEFNSNYGTFAPIRYEVAKKGKAFLRLIVNDADMALDGNGHCADFRFAHDGNIGPLMNLLGIGGYEYSALEEAPYRYWQSFNQICMASNLQLEFYRNAKDDVLVKALYNEKEIGFPGLKAINGVYYKWSDVRRYMISKCEDVREVPDYFVSHLEEKAEEILKIQKDEVEGFYFITDMHFPVNYGNSAALIEALENKTDRRLIVYGGDALTYLDDIDEAMAMQFSSLEQMRGVSPILWARGNHDIVNYTGKKEWITKERKTLPAWESRKILGCLSPAGAVYNENDPYTSYCYYDSPGKKTRFVVFDTSDSVMDDKMQKGLSDTQLGWILEKAVLGAPKGYGIVFISHIPFIGEKPKIAAKDALDAFSTHSTFKLGSKVYDFSARPDVKFLCVICGHRHSDYSYQFPGGQPQINVIADCNYDTMKRTKGTVEEQSFDYVSISKDGHIRTVRIGMGENRLL